MRIIDLENIKNVRDLGGIKTADGRVVVSGLFYRGASLHNATDADKRVLFEDLAIECVIDLRCGWEIDEKPDMCPSNVEYLHIPFYDKKKVGIEYTENAPGTRRIGNDFACVPLDFYRSLANPKTVAQMRKCIHAIFEHADARRPIYQHCSGGKDRTGIMTALLLEILGVDRDDILQDYLYTNVARDSDYSNIFARFLRLADGNEALAHDLTEAHRATPENLQAFYNAIDEGFGSMGNFLTSALCVDDKIIAYAREKFTCPAFRQASSEEHFMLAV